MKKEKTINRIIKFIEYLDISVRQFDISIGAANGYTLRMEKNHASVGSDVIERIVNKYPKLNLVWLITGKGSMLIEDKYFQSEDDVEVSMNKKFDEKWDTKKKALIEEIKRDIEGHKME